MKIELKFTDKHARDITYYLQQLYKTKSTNLAKLCKVAVLHEVARSANLEITSVGFSEDRKN